LNNFSNLPIDQQCRKIFKNFRLKDNKPTGLNLTTFGHTLLQRYFETYKYEIDIVPVGKTRVNLDRAMTWPYYIGKATIVFYHPDDAAWFKLGGNNLEYFAESSNLDP